MAETENERIERETAEFYHGDEPSEQEPTLASSEPTDGQTEDTDQRTPAAS